MHIRGWELIADGIATNDHNKIFSGNAYLFRYEQEVILQRIVFDPMRLLKAALPNAIKLALERSLSDMVISQMPAPFDKKFAQWAKENNFAADVTSLEQRYEWGRDIMLRGFKNYAETDLPGLRRKLDEFLKHEQRLKDNLRMPDE